MKNKNKLHVAGEFTQTVDQPFVPNGSFKQTAKPESILVKLECECNDNNGNWKKSSLDITNLKDPFVINYYGSLEIDKNTTAPVRSFIPDGSYIVSARNIKVTLYAELKKRGKDYKNSTLNITNLPLSAEICNDNGDLKVVHL